MTNAFLIALALALLLASFFLFRAGCRSCWSRRLLRECRDRLYVHIEVAGTRPYGNPEYRRLLCLERQLINRVRREEEER